MQDVVYDVEFVANILQDMTKDELEYLANLCKVLTGKQ